VVQLDREDGVKDLLEFFNDHRFDAVVHLATCFLKTHSFAQIEKLISSNLTLTTQLLEASRQSGVKHFVSFGTFYQFPTPASLYAATKAAQDPILEYYAQTTDLKVSELFLYDTYGPNDTRIKITNALIAACLSEETLDLSPGLQKMKLLHVDDVCSAILTILEARENKKSVERFALEPSEAPSLRELAQKIEHALGKKLHANWGTKAYLPGVAMEPTLPYPKLSGWSAKVSLEDGLMKIIKEC
jgi:nucleoside-diphosphate-sugar epimerase